MIPNNETAAICGLFCGTCPCYPASCHGCLSNTLAPHCKTCPQGFRDCAAAYEVTRCFECQAFPCERLHQFSQEHYQNGIGHHEHIISDLTDMKHYGVDTWVSRKTEAATCPHCGQLVYWYDKNTHKCT